MSSSLSFCQKLLLSGLCCGFAAASLAESPFGPQGGEYPLAGQLRGDQVWPAVALGQSGGYIVWQDNATDGDSSGISARRLDGNFLGKLSPFRVNEQAAGSQENARVALLQNGGAVFVWQGGALGSQEIFARFIGMSGTFTTGDIRVNATAGGQHQNPAVATLADGSVVVTWASHGQDGHMQGVFAQVLNSAGEKVGAEIQINQTTRYNQRTPAVAALSGGNYAIAWVSEQQRFENSVDIYARLFHPVQGAVSSEILINTTTNVCANPVLSAGSSGGFLAGWSERDLANPDNGWDVFVRAFKGDGSAASEAVKVNNHTGGNHYAPQIATGGANSLVTWTSLGQDGSLEGVFGRFVDETTAMPDPEFQVNTWAGNRQMHPAVASDGANQFLAVWTSFVGGSTSFDLFAQRYAGTPIRPTPPFVSALSATRLSVTWPVAGAATVASYEIYVDGSAQPVTVTGNSTIINSLSPGSTHSVRLAYRFASGQRSPLSEPASGTTFGGDENLDGLPDDWQTQHWGGDSSKWPDPKADGDNDGANNLQEFLAGTNPVSAASVLRIQINTTEQGSFLAWNTQAGFIYQVQSSASLGGEWSDVNTPRLAAGATDSILLDAASQALYYRVKRLR